MADTPTTSSIPIDPIDMIKGSKYIISTIAVIANASSPKEKIESIIGDIRGRIKAYEDAEKAKDENFKLPEIIVCVKDKLTQVENALPNIAEGSIRKLNLGMRLESDDIKADFYKKLASVPANELTFDRVKKVLAETVIGNLPKDEPGSEAVLNDLTYDTIVGIALVKNIASHELTRLKASSELQASAKLPPGAALSKKVQQQLLDAIGSPQREVSPRDLTVVQADPAKKKEFEKKEFELA